MDNREKLELLKSKVKSPKLAEAIDKKLGYVNKPVEKQPKRSKRGRRK